MSTIIQPVSYQPGKSKKLLEKLASHMGIHKVTFQLSNGSEIEGIISEIGEDYISIIYPDVEGSTLIPISHIVAIDCPE